MDAAPKSTGRSFEAVYRALVESAPELVIAVLEPDLTVRYVNAAVRTALGWLPEELQGRVCIDFVHEDDRELALRMFEEAMSADDSTPPTLLRARHRDGGWVVLEVVAHSRLSDAEVQGVLVHGRDVTSRMREAARLQRSETRLREIFESVHDGLFLFEVGTGRIIDANRALCALLGYDRHDLIAMNVTDLLPEGGAFERAASTVAGERRALEGVAVRRNDGTLRYSDLALTTLALPEAEPIVVSVVRDVTDRRDAERAKALFFAVVAHELRSPVAVLKSSLGLLRSGALNDDEQAEMLRMHHHELERLARIVAEGLDFSAVHAGKMRVSPAPTALGPLLERLALRWSMQGRAVHLAVEPVTALVDPGRFEQIVTNLLDNAFRHTVSVTRVALVVVRQDGFARVAVEDDGAGIPDALREALFDRYYVVSDRPTRGLGIGLWLSKRFVQAMGGAIGAEPRDGAGSGSRVWFTVPLA